MWSDRSWWPAGSVSRRDVLAATGTASAVGLTGCTRALSSEEREVNIAGSSTVFPIAEAIASDFVQRNPEVNVSVSQTGTRARPAPWPSRRDSSRRSSARSS